MESKVFIERSASLSRFRALGIGLRDEDGVNVYVRVHVLSCTHACVYVCVFYLVCGKKGLYPCLYV